jgi:hypothetical protein
MHAMENVKKHLFRIGEYINSFIQWPASRCCFADENIHASAKRCSALLALKPPVQNGWQMEQQKFPD